VTKDGPRAHSSSEERLFRMIEERTQPDADLARIDERIWDLFGQEWAVMFTDLCGFSRKTAEFGIIHFLQVIYEMRKHLEPVVERHDGVIVKTEADSQLILFKRPENGLKCALAMMTTCAQINRRRNPEEQILLGLGLGFGPLLRIGDTDVFGREVNAASKLGEDTAGAGEILLTEDFRKAVEDFPGVTFEPLGIEVAGSSTNWKAIEAAPPLR
jgi:adenylate cyclase